MIRQNRAVPILLVLTFAWLLYLGGCFGSEEDTSAAEPAPTVAAPTATVPPVVTTNGAAAFAAEEPLFHTIEEGDLLGDIATKYNTTQDMILRANPNLNPNWLVVGDTLRIPGASTINTVEEDRAAAREAGEPIDYVIEAGDTLGAIANTWTVTSEALLDANPGLDANTLQIGQLIVIPPFGSGFTPDQVAEFRAPTCAEREPGEPLRHIVEPGDSASALAHYYGITVEELIAANALPDENALIVGQDLLIPPSDESNCE